MPKPDFLKPGEKLNKNNILQLCRPLKARATRQVADLPTEIDKYYDDIERIIEEEKLHYLINLMAPKMKPAYAHNFALSVNIGEEQLRTNALDSYLDLVNEYAPEGEEKQEVIALINEARRDPLILKIDVADRVRQLLPEEHEDKVLTTDVCFIPPTFILRRFDEFLVIMQQNLSNQELEEIGDKVNAFKSKYEYAYTDDITKTLYDDETADLISKLNNEKMVDGKALNDDEIREYEEALMRANALFGEPKIDLDGMVLQKNNLDAAIDNDQTKDYGDRLRNMGYDPDVVRHVSDRNLGPHHVIVEGKEEAFNTLKNGMEITFSNESKAGIKEILTKLHEFGYDHDGIAGEQGTKVYGLKALYDAGLRYKEAISSPDENVRKNAIKYAKEVYDADKNMQTLLKLIDKHMPVTRDNLSYPGNVDSLRTDLMPPEYRLDYIRVSHLANLYSLANMIEEKHWNLDDFLNNPMHFLRDYYKNDYLDKADPVKMNEGLTGDDLIFSIGRYSITKNVDNMLMGGGRIVEGLVDCEKDPELRKRNAAIYKAFSDTIFEPYNTAYGFRENVARNKNLDSIIINPNIKFQDLKIKTFNGETLKFDEPENRRFDEIKYIKDRTESLSELRDRINLSILKYMKNEIELGIAQNKPGVMYINSESYVNLTQKALAKILTARREERDDPAYGELETLLRNKGFYVQGLLEEVNENGKYRDYMIVKNTNSHPIRFGNTVFNPTHFDNGNKYRNTLDEFDRYKTEAKARIKTELANFMTTQKGINADIRNAYQRYTSALNKYNNEIRKVYGANYKGEVDNSRSEKLMDAFTKKNEFLNEFNRIKGRALESIEERVREGRVPLSYYEDRRLQVENNDYKDIPPLFRTDKPYTMDQYIKIKHPNDYEMLSNEEKQIIFNSYKKEIEKMENDFFSRKFLISKGLTPNRNETFVIQKFRNNDVERQEFSERELEADLIGLSAIDIVTKNIADEETNFDEIKYLREKNQEIAEFKKTIDEKLLSYIKEYKEALNNKEALRALPKINEVMDVFQKTTLKYLMTVGEADKLNPVYKELRNFITDGNGYANKLIQEENNKIDARNHQRVQQAHDQIMNQQEQNGQINMGNLEDKLTYKMADLGSNDNEINKYTNVFKEFETYYKNAIKNNEYEVPYELQMQESIINQSLLREFKAYNRLVSEHDRIELNNADPTKPRIITDVDFPTRIRNTETAIKNYKNIAKERLCNSYRRGLITEEYFKERFKRLDNNNLILPELFSANKLQSMDDYVKTKYPNDYKDLSKEEKTQIYNRYKLEAEENRRQFILNKFLIEKGLTKFNKPTCDVYEAFKAEHERQENLAREGHEEVLIQRANDLNRVNEQIQKRRDLEIHENEDNDKAFEELVHDKLVPDFGDIEEIKNEEDEDIIEEYKENLEYKGQFDEMESYQNQREYIADIISGKNDEMIDPFAKWIESLRNVIKSKMGEEAYNEEHLDEKYAYDYKKDDFAYWFDTNISSLDTLLGGRIKSIFREATNNLEDMWKAKFEKSILEMPEYEKYFPDCFKDKEDVITKNPDNKKNNIIENNNNQGNNKKNNIDEISIDEDSKDIIEDSFMNRVYNAMKKENEDDEIDDIVNDVFDKVNELENNKKI